MNNVKRVITFRQIFHFTLIVIGALLLSQLIAVMISILLKVDITDIYNIQDSKTIYALKFIQLISSTLIFIIAPLIFAINTRYNYKKLFYISNNSVKSIVLIIFFLIVSIPIVNASEIIWQQILSLDIFKNIMLIAKQQELENQAIIKLLLTQNGPLDIILNICVIALIPAIGEEVFFRGTIQNFLSHKINPHVAIILVSVIFGIVHMEVTGIFPRILISLYLGYLFYWSGSIIYSIIAHFLNNLNVLLAYYLIGISPSKLNEYSISINMLYLILLCTPLAILILINLKKNLNKFRLV